MVQMNRMAGKAEKRCGSERRVDGKGLEIAHNGVRGDEVVEVRSAPGE
jgi:hypothetical protein